MLANQNRPPSMTDVAQLAQVSYQTVSRVLNTPEKVAPQTRSRVEQAIKQLGYRPNHAARMLKTKQSRLIGVICSDTHQSGPVSTLNALHNAAHQAGYGIQVGFVSKNRGQDPLQVVRSLLSYRVDGIIAITTQKWVKKILTVIPDSTPAVVVSAGFKSSRQLSVISIDQYAGAQMALRHLLEQGYDQINHLAGPTEWYDAEARLAGWQDLIEQNPQVSGTWAQGDWSEESGYHYLSSLYPHLPSAIFAANDQMALGIIRFCWEKGIKIPQDLALVGFDNVPSSAYFSPSLTTVEQPFAQLGQTATQLLFGRLNGDASSTMAIMPNLIIRESSQLS